MAVSSSPSHRLPRVGGHDPLTKSNSTSPLPVSSQYPTSTFQIHPPFDEDHPFSGKVTSRFGEVSKLGVFPIGFHVLADRVVPARWYFHFEYIPATQYLEDYPVILSFSSPDNFAINVSGSTSDNPYHCRFRSGRYLVDLPPGRVVQTQTFCSIVLKDPKSPGVVADYPSLETPLFINVELFTRYSGNVAVFQRDIVVPQLPNIDESTFKIDPFPLLSGLYMTNSPLRVDFSLKFPVPILNTEVYFAHIGIISPIEFTFCNITKSVVDQSYMKQLANLPLPHHDYLPFTHVYADETLLWTPSGVYHPFDLVRGEYIKSQPYAGLTETISPVPPLPHQQQHQQRQQQDHQLKQVYPQTHPLHQGLLSSSDVDVCLAANHSPFFDDSDPSQLLQQQSIPSTQISSSPSPPSPYGSHYTSLHLDPIVGGSPISILPLPDLYANQEVHFSCEGFLRPIHLIQRRYTTHSGLLALSMVGEVIPQSRFSTSDFFYAPFSTNIRARLGFDNLCKYALGSLCTLMIDIFYKTPLPTGRTFFTLLDAGVQSVSFCYQFRHDKHVSVVPISVDDLDRQTYSLSLSELYHRNATEISIQCKVYMSGDAPHQSQSVHNRNSILFTTLDNVPYALLSAQAITHNFSPSNRPGYDQIMLTLSRRNHANLSLMSSNQPLILRHLRSIVASTTGSRSKNVIPWKFSRGQAPVDTLSLSFIFKAFSTTERQTSRYASLPQVIERKIRIFMSRFPRIFGHDDTITINVELFQAVDIPVTSHNQIRDHGESDIDCGGPYAPLCLDHHQCFTHSDCTNGRCASVHPHYHVAIKSTHGYCLPADTHPVMLEFDHPNAHWDEHNRLSPFPLFPLTNSGASDGLQFSSPLVGSLSILFATLLLCV